MVCEEDKGNWVHDWYSDGKGVLVGRVVDLTPGPPHPRVGGVWGSL